MAFVSADRVQETSTTTGTGTYTLAGAVTDFQSFAAIGDGNTCYYSAVMAGGGWEVGLGTYTASGTTLARTTILASSNAGAAVSWGAGTKTIFCTIPAIQASEPVGTIKALAHATVPFGYLACDGAAVSRTTYATLFVFLSTTWGAGNGSTTFNVPDLRSRVLVGSGTGTVAETQAAANFNVSDVITVTSNLMELKPKWLTGMPVVVTTDGVLPTGISAATTYFVRRLSATTISLYDTFAQAINTAATTGIRNITATGSGNHTLTCTLSVRALAETFGFELLGANVAHTHTTTLFSNASAAGATQGGSTGSTSPASSSSGDATGVTNMPPSAVVQFAIKY